MSAEENKAIVSHFYEELDKGNLDVADEILSSNCVFHFPGGDGLLGPESYKEQVAPFVTAFPDSKHIHEDMITEGDKVVAHGTVRGTHEGEYMGIAPTGKQVMFTGIGIFRIAEGKFIEAWIEFDRLGLMQQLGAVPPIGQAGE